MSPFDSPVSLRCLIPENRKGAATEGAKVCPKAIIFMLSNLETFGRNIGCSEEWERVMWHWCRAVVKPLIAD